MKRIIAEFHIAKERQLYIRAADPAVDVAVIAHTALKEGPIGRFDLVAL